MYGVGTMRPEGIAIMLARQRSGTNALRRVLHGHPEVFASPEVFHAEPSPGSEFEWDMNFFRFLERHPKATAWRSQSVALQEEIFLDFLTFLRGFSEKRFVVLDVKLNSTHHLDGPWRSVTDVPSLFMFVKKHRVPTLHLTRRNYLRYYLSWAKAELTDSWAKWDQDPKGPTDEPRLEVDVDDLMWRMDQCRSEELLTSRFLGGPPEYLTFDYDDMFPTLGSPVSNDVLRRVTKWLGLSEAFATREPTSRKMSALALPDTIKNFAEVEDALLGTVYEYCLADERVYQRASAEPASSDP